MSQQFEAGLPEQADGQIDWEALRRESHQRLRRKTIAHINAGTTDLSDGPRLIATSAYTDPERHRLELEKIFRSRPVFAGLTGDIPEPGDTLLFEEVGPPILLVRNKEEKLKAFLNMCTHRAAKLVPECSNKKRLTCRFHGWTFNLDGDLVGLPGAEGFEGIAKEDRGLIPIPVVEWHGLIFVRAVAHGAPIEISEVMDEKFSLELAHLQLQTAKPMKRSRIDVRCNWKYAMDTYGEGYHFGSLHPSSIGALAFSNIMSYENYGPNHRIAMPRADFMDYADKDESEWPPTSYGGLYYIFPNVVINCNTMSNGEQFFGISRVFPGESVDSCTTLMTTYKPAHMAEDADPVLWTDMHDFIHKVVETEDYSVSRGGQVNMQYAPADFQPILGANELALQNIHKWLDDIVNSA